MLIGYARVSTMDQDPALQIDALTAAGCERIFQETASGAKQDRPQLAGALSYLRPGDTLVVWKFDRLARSTRQLIETMEDLKTRGIGLRSLTEQIDTSTPGGALVYTIFSAVAQFERDMIRERTNAGLIAARARGRQGGRPEALSEVDKGTILLLLQQTDRPFSDIAPQFNVTVSTLARHFPGGRAKYRVGPTTV
ncbi:recombinase family protein [Microvirga alba]|uniref:Recombinase family protein n=1 Tax=Microvirga alba TaxID=2791025 RepID=A0A931BRI5_9HYPH|nr:recombinase family protein [Microvirga alba]MBF9235601.1 recombinase family protein [Microvirga alba]